MSSGLRASMRSLLLRAGIDVRFRNSEKKHRARIQREQDLERWQFITAYHPQTVLDIGANVGQFASIVRELLPTCRIVSFEPLRNCCDELKSREAELAPITIVHGALGAEQSTVEMNRNQSTPSSSLLPMHDRHVQEVPKTKQVTTETVTVYRLDDMNDELKFGSPLITKIDVQGYTLPVLQGGKSTIQQSAVVVAEISTTTLYEGEATFAEVYQLMSDLGFDFAGTVDQWHSKSDGRVLQMDCIFTNRTQSCGTS